MTSSFRTAGAWGGGLGRPLTWVEQDNNTYDKETRITSLEAAGGAVGIASITQSGGTLIITMTDSSVYTFDLTQLTAQWVPRGEWQPLSVYHALDLVNYGGTCYLVNVDHTSEATFDPNQIEGTVEAYTAVFSFQPIQGFNRIVTLFTPQLEDANTYNRMTNVLGCVVSIDPAVAFPAWTELTFRDECSGTGATLTFEMATGGGTINGVDGYLNQSAGKGATVVLKQVDDSGNWDIMGRLASV